MDEVRFEALLADVEGEGADLAESLIDLPADGWHRATPSAGWDVHDQLVHLAYFDDLAAVALTDEDQFAARVDEVSRVDPEWVDVISWSRRELPGPALLEWFRTARATMLEVMRAAGPAARCPWIGPPMSAASSATARLMETWAHGQDVYDGLGLSHPPTDRVTHICHLGVITRKFAYQLRGLEVPEVGIRVELVAPGGRTLTWGPVAAPDRVVGNAVDFALLVTQRRHRADTGLEATGSAASQWLDIAQVFAGPPGAGRERGRF